MIPRYLKIQGFRSFNSNVTINFTEIPEGLNLVTGTNKVEPELEGNGVGKSSIFEALTWCLFGKTSTNLKAGDIVNWSGKHKCKVEFCFGEDESDNLIVRTQSPNSLSLNGKTVTQDELEDVLKLNLKSFIYSIFLSQFGDKFVDLSPSDKMSVFTDIMDDVLSRWNTYSDKAKAKKEKAEKELISKDMLLSGLKGKLEASELESLKEKSQEWIRNRELEISKVLDKVDITKAKIKVLSYEINGYKIYEDGVKITELEKEKEDLEKIFYVNVSKRTKLLTNQINFDVQKRRQEELRDGLLKLEPICPVCHQSVDKNIIEKEISDLEKEIEQLSIDLQNATKALEKLDKRNSKLTEEITEVTEEIASIHLLAKLEESKKEKAEDQLTNLNNELVFYNEQIKNLNSDNPYNSLITEAKKKIKEIESEIANLEKEIDEERIRFEAYKFLQKGFKDIKLMLTSEALVELEVNINNNIQKLGLGKGWNVFLDIMEETKSGAIKKGFTVLIESPNNHSLVPFECWSGGEGQRLRLAISLGLSDFIKDRRGINWNWIILDEPSQFLSETGIIQMINILKEKAKDEQMKVFLIDHRKLPVLGEFDLIINVTKTSEGSRIEWQITE